MSIMRNFIEVDGIAAPDELPDQTNAHLIEYSEVEYIFIPGETIRLNNIYQIAFQIEITSNRCIDTPIGRTYVIDGIKKFKIVYIPKGNRTKPKVLEFETPYNTFIEFPDNRESIKNIDIHVLDAYFALIDSKKIYSHMVYLLNVHHQEKNKDFTQSQNIQTDTNYVEIIKDVQKQSSDEIIMEID